MTALVAFLSAFAVSYVATIVLLRFRPRGGFVDVPNERSSHETPKPRFGGIAIALAFTASMLGLLAFEPGIRDYLPLLFGALLLFVTGLVDDWRRLSVGVRFAMQLAAALIAVSFGNVIDHVFVPIVGTVALSWMSIPLTVLFIMASVNFYNFVDGIDGLAAGSAFFASLFLALISMILGHNTLGIVYLIVAGSTVGFLQYNFPPSRLFMGDSGSTFLGYFFACTTIAGNQLTPELPVFIPLLILSSLYLDAGLTLIGRLSRGEKILQAHHTHYYQRLLSLGLNHKQVTLLEYLLTILLGCSSVVYFKAGGYFGLFLSLVWFTVFTGVILKIRGLERGDRLFWERRTVFVILTDIVLISISYVGAYFLRMNFQFTDAEGRAMMGALPIVLVIRTAVFFKYGLYRSLWKYTGVTDVVRVIKAITTGSVLILTGVVLLYRFVAFPRTLFVIEYFLLTLLILGSRFSLRLFHEIGREAHGANVSRYGIIGAGDYGERLGREIHNLKGSGGVIACYIDDDPSKVGLLLHGAPIEGPVARTAEICRRHNVDTLAIGVRRAGGASMATIVAAAQAAGVELAGMPARLGGEREPAALTFARLSRHLGREPLVLTDRAQRMFAGRRVLITHGGERIGNGLADELVRLGAVVTRQFDSAREHELVGGRRATGRIGVRLGSFGSLEEASAMISSTDPEFVFHCVSLEAGVDEPEEYLWKHIVRSTDAICRAVAVHAVERLVLVGVWGGISGGSVASNMMAIAEARMLGTTTLADTTAAALRLPRILTSTDAFHTARIDDVGEYDVTEPESVVHVVNLAAENSRGIFVPWWRGSIVVDDIRNCVLNASSEDDVYARGGLERTGPLFPSEQLHPSALAGIRRVSGPLYPASDVFKKVLASASVGTTSSERDDWLRVIAGHLYHIVPAGLGTEYTS